MEFQRAVLQFSISRDLPEVEIEGISWFFHKNGDQRSITPGEKLERYVFSKNLLSLTIINLTQADDGNYTMEASNVVGTGADTITLDVQSK